MKKINGGYASLFEYLVKQKYSFARSIKKALYPPSPDYQIPFSYPRYNTNPRNWVIDQYLGALQPFNEMLHDVEYTFKPYSTEHEKSKDTWQILRGLINIFHGLASLLLTPIAFTWFLFRDISHSKSFSNFMYNCGLNFVRSSSWIIDGVARMIRGSTQIIAAPLILFKIPLRIIITKIKGSPDINQNEEIRRLYEIGNNLKESDKPDEMLSVSYLLHRKFQKCRTRGQPTNINVENEHNISSGLFERMETRRITITNRDIDPETKRTAISDLNLRIKKDSAAYISIFKEIKEEDYDRTLGRVLIRE